jgi:DNA-binding XRE family transcriptional regulator
MSSNIGQQPEIIVKRVNIDGTETPFKIELENLNEIIDNRVEKRLEEILIQHNEITNSRTSEAKTAYHYDGVWVKTEYNQNKKYRMENNLKNVIRKSGISQGRIAEMVGINESTLSDIVNAKSSSSTLTIFKLCAILNVPVDGTFWLVVDDD